MRCPVEHRISTAEMAHQVGSETCFDLLLSLQAGRIPSINPVDDILINSTQATVHIHIRHEHLSFFIIFFIVFIFIDFVFKNE